MTKPVAAQWGPLSPEVVARSLSPREPILRLGDVREALDQLRCAGFGVLGWEGIVHYPDGTYRHSSQIVGTESINRNAAEEWDQYVERSVEFCRRTIEQSAIDWQSDHELCYAITLAPPPSTISNFSPTTPSG